MHLLVCPVCEAGIGSDGRVIQCVNGHTFDVAREGYVNLLRTRPHGDTREMLLARRRFFERGHYTPLSDAINAAVGDHLLELVSGDEDYQPRSVLDAGCGEGYYLGSLKRYLDGRAERDGRCYIGMDVSKEAVRMASRRYGDIGFFVGDVKQQMPLVGGSVGALLNVFAPRNPEEFARVVAPGGLLLTVIPDVGHLAELRSALRLLDLEEHKQGRVNEQFADSFLLVGSITVQYELVLDRDDVELLVRMTPNYWHAPEETWSRIRAMDGFRAGAAFTVLTYHRKQ